MQILLLAIIAACLLFGSAAVLDALAIGGWVFLAVMSLIVALIVIGVVLVVIGYVGATIWLPFQKASEAYSRRQIQRATGAPKFRDKADYLDWANRRGRWAGDDSSDERN